MSVQNSPPLAETIVVKAVFTNHENLVGIAERLDTRDLSYRPYRIMFNAIKRLCVSGTVVNTESVLAYLESKAPNNYRDIMEVGGATFIDSLYDPAYKTLVNLDEHVAVITEQADSKLIQEATSKLQTQLSTGISYESALDEFDKSIHTIRLRGKKDDVKPIGADMRNMLNRIAQRDEAILGISIEKKFPKLNKMIKRIQPNRVTIVLSNYKSGKSTLLLELGWYLAYELNVPVLFGDTELYADEFRIRLLAKMTGFSMDYIQGGLWVNSAEHTEIIKDATYKIEQTPFYWVNVNHMSKSQIVATVKLAQLQHQIRVFVYDYIKSDVENPDARIDKQIGAKVDMLKESIAKSCNIAVLSAIQMNSNTGRAADSQEADRLGDNVIILRKTDEEDPEHLLASHLLILKTSRYSAMGQRVGIDIDFEKQSIREC